MNLNELNIKQARELLDSGKITSLEITEACLAQIASQDGGIHACLTVCANEAREAAQAADKRLKQGERGALLGIPYLCKDILMTKGIRTTAASKILENYVAPYDATVVRKLKEAGAVMLGKTNLDEFAHGASTENSAFGPTKNPYDLTRVAGGSSGGSAAGVAANMCLFALASDTGGSIRQPSSFCGVVGLKPSYGRVSRFGLLSMTSSTDVIGPIAKTAEDAEIIFKVIAGQDELDATSAPEKIISDSQKKIIDPRAKTLNGLRVGLPKEYFLPELNPEIRNRVMVLADKLKDAGAEIKEVSLPYTKYGIPVYYIITPSEISSNLARFDGIGWGLKDEEAQNLQEFYKKSRGAGFGPEAKRRIMLGTYALSAGYYDAYYKKAQTVRTLIINDFNQAFKQVDVLLTPTVPHGAFKIGEKSNDPLAMYLEDIFVTGASLAGLPAISVPAGTVKVKDGGDMPLGAQLIAPRFQEETLFKITEFLV
ncbi:MAG: Asp-tRNA(Asn)/Glu-tRNA(Gln) amidotransferase subunit GatA [Candidatus Falkowbacteria bacterium]|nr:MAG: Asp-tRNA(Asn)/Glu-tRNA(Gln) amidotransferase subunit GatA [Candidatus Falkowbacteria bacterium]